jgi:hypothetical protein
MRGIELNCGIAWSLSPLQGGREWCGPAPGPSARALTLRAFSPPKLQNLPKQHRIVAELDALLPAILDRAFKGKL